MMGPIGIVVFWYVIGAYIMGFFTFARGEDKKVSLIGAVLFVLSPIMFPILLLVLIAKLLVDLFRSF